MEERGFTEKVFHHAGDADGCMGGWVCSKCHGSIEKVPFKPDPGRLNRLMCLNCYRDSRSNRG